MFNLDFSLIAILSILILTITGVKSVADHLEFISKNTIVDRVIGDSKVDKAKSQVKSQAKLFKSKFLIELGFRPGFLTYGARLAFTKSKRIFIKVLILYHYDLQCHI